MTVKDYDDVPGTYVLDSRTYRRGYYLNMFLMTLNKQDARDAFAADEKGYMADFNLTDEQIAAVLERRYLDMLKLGANVYYAFKLVSHDRKPPQVMYGKMARPEMSFEQFQEMMINGGRPIDGNRSKSEQKDG
ncbi:MAG: protocatechuate 3,4-dioxygenase [Candidatus Puniceispirillaceae bacterium]